MTLRSAISVLLIFTAVACRSASAPDSEARQSRKRPVVRSSEAATVAMLDDLQKRSFLFFWETTNPENGLVPDRWPTPSFSSIAAVGFGLASYPVGAERSWITRAQARDRVLSTLEFFATAPRGPQAAGIAGHKGFFYHFLDMQSGHRYRDVELSTIDTTLLLGGVLVCQSYFDRDDPKESKIRELAEKIYREVDWTYFLHRPPLVAMGWTPEKGFGTHDWRGLDEASMLYVLALGSPTHPIDPAAWTEWTSTYQWRSYYGWEHVNFAPLFGHQYSHIFIDFRGIQDAYFREKGIDMFENSRRAVYAQRAYGMDNPNGWKGYGENVWGLTACDGPGDGTAIIDGRARHFMGYAARGASAVEVRDDGTIAPTAAAASLPFAPEIVIPAVEEIHRRWGRLLYQKYGFLDSFNPTLVRPPDFRLEHGSIDPELGWINSDYLGIDQGPIVLMIENHRTGLIWETLKKNPHVIRGLRRAGFSGGWLDTAPVE